MKLKKSIKKEKFILIGIIFILTFINESSIVTSIKIKLDASMKIDKSFLLSKGNIKFYLILRK
jgi:hypothetical protein